MPFSLLTFLVLFVSSRACLPTGKCIRSSYDSDGYSVWKTCKGDQLYEERFSVLSCAGIPYSSYAYTISSPYSCTESCDSYVYYKLKLSSGQYIDALQSTGCTSGEMVTCTASTVTVENHDNSDCSGSVTSSYSYDDGDEIDLYHCSACNYSVTLVVTVIVGILVFM
eukprot:UN01250